LFAELYGILFGSHIAREMHLTHVILEIDLIHVDNMINNWFLSFIFNPSPGNSNMGTNPNNLFLGTLTIYVKN
jgi:hypothetical protein